MDEAVLRDFQDCFDESCFPADFLNNYEAIECLGHNEQGETLLVRSRVAGDYYVAKCYDKELPLPQAAEDELLKDIRRESLPRYTGRYQNEKMLCIVREYMEGESLDRLALEVRFTPEQVIRTGKELCDILIYLHGHHPAIIHRDIKPQNIIRNREGKLCLIDFGISRFYHKGALCDTVCYGTTGFAAPEQYGFSQTDSRSDIYSLGIVLCWLLTGEADRSKALPGVKHRRLKSVLAKCTEFAPERRYSSAEHLKAALGRAEKKRRRSVVGVIGILLLCGMCLGAGFLIGRCTDISMPAVADSGVHFEEPLIEEAVRLSLGKPEESKISEEELLQIREVYIFGNLAAANSKEYDRLTQRWADKDESLQNGGIRSLQDIAMLKNLKVLNITLQNITDVTPLKDLNSLEAIELKHNPIKEVSALKNLPALQRIQFYDTRISDISVLSNCPRLDNLAVGMTNIKSLDAFAGLERLCCLDASGITLESLAGIEKFPYLQEISFYSVEDQDLGPLLALPQLKKVSLNRSMKEAGEKVAEAADFEMIYTE